MKILVTGVNGQLGNELVKRLSGRHDVIGFAREQLDLSNPAAVESKISGHSFDWLINCAAYTQVDLAEDEIDLSNRINCDSVQAMANAVAAQNARMLQVSTDFVFNGKHSCPYQEDNVIDPIGQYGHSKAEGERAILQTLSSALLIRTGWVCGGHGKNFVKTILRLAHDRDKLTVVDDQIGTPTFTVDLAQAIEQLVTTNASGIYHFSNEGVASWYDFAVAIVEEGKEHGILTKDCKVMPIPCKSYPTKATRPAYSVLSKAKIRPVLGYDIPHWRTSLRNLILEIKHG